MKRGFIVVALLIGLLAVMAVASSAQVAYRSDAWIPGLASFIIPGLGQLINDQIDKAITHFAVFVAIDVGGWYLTALVPWHYYGYNYRYSIIAVAHFAWALYSGLDAYNVAKDTGFSLGMTDDRLTLSYNF